MDRNSPCFCGSGKKYKKCHPDIHPDSFFAQLILLYKDADKAIEDKKPDVKCKKGCSKCCYQNFDISSVEFAYIFSHLLRNNKEQAMAFIERGYSQWLDYKEQNPEGAKRLSRNNEYKGEQADSFISRYMNETPTGIQNNTFPCPFLEDGACAVYDIRPYVCRHHGVGFIDNRYMFADISFCEETPNGINGTKLVDLSHLDTNFLVGMYSKTLNQGSISTPYPIFYHCKIYKENMENSIHKLSEYMSTSMELASTQRISRALARMK